MFSDRILDLTDEKGALCTRLLAGMGMGVIRVEPPGGDLTRTIGPFLNDQPHPERSLFFWQHNLGKRSVTLDLDSAEGLSLFLRLADKADGLVESLEPGRLEGLGIDYRTLSARNPGLVMTSITPFGQTGPQQASKACDLTLAALGGQAYLNGEAGGPPLKLPGNQAYGIASLHAAVGTLLALRRRQATGRGQHVDVSIQACVAAALDHALVRYFSDGAISQRQGSLHWTGGFRLFPCRDGHVLLSLFQDWEVLVEWMEGEGMAGDLIDPRWRDREFRRERLSHVIEVLERWTRSHTAAELVEKGQFMRFPWAKAVTVSELLASPQLRAREFFVRVDHPFDRLRAGSELGASYEYPGMPYRTDGARPPRRAPLVGGDNEAILEELRRFNETLPSTDSVILSGAKNLPGDTDAEPGPCPGRPIRFARGDGNSRGSVDRSQAPLSGIRVLDFGWVLAAPYATRLLADYGAEVIKVQPLYGAEGEDAFSRAYFNTWNRNKLGITLNMGHARGRELAERLVAMSDVVVENFSPRVMENWGLDYERLRALKPDIILLSLSAMGHSGPWRDHNGFGPAVHAAGGLTRLTGFPGRPPSGPGFSYADHVAGLCGAMAVLEALEQRRLDGQGRYIDLSEVEAMVSMLGTSVLDYTANGREAEPPGNRSAERPAAPHGIYPCRGNDRWCAIAVFTDEEWRSLRRAIGDPEWARSGRFATMEDRLANAGELDRLLGQWTRQRAAGEVMSLMQETGIAAGAVQDASDLARDPQLESRGFFITLDHADLGLTKMDGTPMKLSETPATFRRAAPLPGQDNDRVFGGLLGLGEEEIRGLRQERVI